jgi:hypothetical protein
MNKQIGGKKKNRVQLYWTGCWQVPIHRRDPTTDRQMFLSHLANSTVVIMNLVTGTKYSGISQIVATNHKNIKISEMTLSCLYVIFS